MLRRQELGLHFWLTPDWGFCKNSAVYIRGGRIDELHAEFSKNILEHLTEFR